METKLINVIKYFYKNGINHWKISTYNGLDISWYDNELEKRNPTKCATNYYFDNKINHQTKISCDIVDIIKKKI
jgi:hypothetical protein